MPTVSLSNGTIEYRVVGPADAARPVVFVHGFLVNGELWSGVADVLARHGVRSYAPTWPLGSHAIAMAPDADQTPRGVARTVIEFLEALDLEDVTLVGNDSGGAISQFVIDTDPSRIGRLVLTNCDAFDQFPPAPFDRLFRLLSTPRRIRFAIAPTRLRAVRHSALGFGLLVRRPLPADVTARWVAPCGEDAGVRRDTAKFLRAVDAGELLDVAARLGASRGRSCSSGARPTGSSGSSSPEGWRRCSPTRGWSRSRAEDLPAARRAPARGRRDRRGLRGRSAPAGGSAAGRLGASRSIR